MSNPLGDLLCRFDIAFSDGYQPKDRTILLGMNPVVGVDGIVQLTALRPEGISSSCALAEVLKFHADEPREEILLRWTSPLKPPCTDAGVYMFVDIRTLHDDVASFLVDAQCVPISLSRQTNGPLSVLELCAGGYGGWSKACGFLSEHFDVAFRILSVESCLQAAWCFSVSNGVPLIGGSCDVPDGFLSALHGLVLHVDLREKQWLSIASRWAPELITISAPCGPWSTAGQSQGLGSDDGMVLAESVAVCKLLRPSVVVIEQVPGFASHQHKKWIIGLLRWAGYTLKYAKILDAGEQCATSRAGLPFGSTILMSL